MAEPQHRRSWLARALQALWDCVAGCLDIASWLRRRGPPPKSFYKLVGGTAAWAAEPTTKRDRHARALRCADVQGGPLHRLGTALGWADGPHAHRP